MSSEEHGLTEYLQLPLLCPVSPGADSVLLPSPLRVAIYHTLCGTRSLPFRSLGSPRLVPGGGSPTSVRITRDTC